MFVGEKIRELRLENDLLQRELAEKIQIAPNTLSQFESGKANPSYEVLISIADFFECSTDYLLGRSDDLGVISISSQKQNAAELTPDGSELLDLFNGLEKEYRAQVLEYVRFIAERRNAVKRKKY